jgi:hypothetical protein
VQVNNPIGSGGAGSVTTDGVTIQGAGTVPSPIALKQVETDATITGAGTVASPLSATGATTTDNVTIQGTGVVASPIAIKAVQRDATLSGAGTVASPLGAVQQTPTGWPLTWWDNPIGGTNGTALFASSINTLSLNGIAIPAQVRFNSIVFQVTIADAVNNCDIGLYNSAGTLVAHIGAQILATTGLKNIAVVGAPITLNPGRYYLATTSNATTATYETQTGNGNLCFLRNANFGSSSGGALPNTITPPADSVAQNQQPVFALIF